MVHSPDVKKGSRLMILELSSLQDPCHAGLREARRNTSVTIARQKTSTHKTADEQIDKNKTHTWLTILLLKSY
jgi:hypothetical protein